MKATGARLKGEMPHPLSAAADKGWATLRSKAVPPALDLRAMPPPLLNFECSILLTLHVVNFGHLDGFVP
jgi:hypothetical protein